MVVTAWDVRGGDFEQRPTEESGSPADGRNLPKTKKNARKEGLSQALAAACGSPVTLSPSSMTTQGAAGASLLLMLTELEHRKAQTRGKKGASDTVSHIRGGGGERGGGDKGRRGRGDGGQ